MRWWRLVFVSLLFGWSPTDVASQPSDKRLEVARCIGCRISERVIAVIGRTSDSILITRRSRVVRLGNSQYLVGPLASPGLLGIYSASGILRRVVGRRGSGPLEFSTYFGPVLASPSRVALVVDPANARLTLVDTSGKLHDFGRYTGSVLGGVGLDNGRFLFNGQYRTPKSFGFPLHIIESGARVVRSFGALSTTVDPRAPITQFVRIVAKGKRGQMWYAPNNEYRITLADSLGRTELVLTRPYSSPDPDGTGMLSFFIASIREDTDGRLWVVSGLRRTRSKLGKDQAITPGTLETLAGDLTSSIDVIDPERAQVLASKSLPEAPYRQLDDSLAYRYREDAAGNPRIEILALRLLTPTPKPVR